MDEYVKKETKTEKVGENVKKHTITLKMNKNVTNGRKRKKTVEYVKKKPTKTLKNGQKYKIANENVNKWAKT